MRRLLLLRHAKSDWPPGVADEDRPLAARGRLAAPLMGDYLARAALIPDRVLVSPAKRTVQTWELIQPALPVTVEAEFVPALYEAHEDDILAVIRTTPAAVRSLLIVGHNPGLEQLAASIVDYGAEPALKRLAHKFPTSGLAVIELPVDDWSDARRHTGRLDRFVTPKSLGSAED
ncbi:SixA phosphatase family protein [Ancylobacter terrae]|uniref:SixA phosphatase family protein n=1 Tax=Ancylobacter sp. sgz301288 TaxID=3342077 RepID=UPI00385EF775